MRDSTPAQPAQPRNAHPEISRWIRVEANAAGLRTLAGHLLTLAQDGVPDGSHLHLEDSNGLEDGSVGLVLERSDDE
ncbi:hypothetical protein ABZV67_41565 [Streptomyces sp. NPDC005065]|uniref:Imm32 family immunity protein n=1 Tax=Streptomyces sp. NPDC005065 TaxID=3154461 RepID=UPI0033A20505